MSTQESKVTGRVPVAVAARACEVMGDAARLAAVRGYIDTSDAQVTLNAQLTQAAQEAGLSAQQLYDWMVANGFNP